MNQRTKPQLRLAKSVASVLTAGMVGLGFGLVGCAPDDEFDPQEFEQPPAEQPAPAPDQREPAPTPAPDPDEDGDNGDQQEGSPAY